MHHYAAIILMSATPYNTQMTTATTPAFTDQGVVAIGDGWTESLIDFLDWLCEILGPLFCPVAGVADPNLVMINFVNAYEVVGVPQGLTSKQEFRVRNIVEDIYAHLAEPSEASPGTIDSMEEALISLYVDVGGDPADLMGN
jgi:hypothetical protein